MAVIAMSTVGASAAGTITGFEATEAGSIVGFLRELGHSVVEPGDTAATHFVAMDHNDATLALVADRVPVANRILVVQEPQVVKPANYSPRVQSKYGHVFAFNKVSGDRAVALPLPQRDWTIAPQEPVERIPGLSVLINANKLSSIKGSLYGLRRKTISAFDAAGLPLTLAGSGWRKRGRALLVDNLRAIAYAGVNRQRIDFGEWATPLPLDGSVDYIGLVDDKDALMRTAEFAIVIENNDRYVSEKLFDAVIAGCVPLFVGAPLERYGIPSTIAIELPQSPAAFVNAVRTLGESHKRAVLEAGHAWINDPETFREWGMPTAMLRLATGIDSVLP